MNKVILKKGRDWSVRKHHPWIFSGAVESGAAGQGETVEEALRHVGAAVEGYYAADSIEHLARELRIDMPICSAIYRVLYKGHSAAKEIAPLMRRAGFSEFRQ